MEYYERPGLSSFWIKIIACVTMVIDHSAQIIYNVTESTKAYQACKAVGRLSFPLFCFILVEGFFYTRSRAKHAILLAVFAVISNPFYNFYSTVMKKGFVLGKTNFLSITELNILFTLLLGFLAIWLIDFVKYKNSDENGVSTMGQSVINWIVIIAVTIAACVIAYFINCMYAYSGVIMIVGLYLTRKKVVGQFIVIAISSLLFSNFMISHGHVMVRLSPTIQWAAVFAIIPIFFYNNTPGIRRWKYFFYVFYPVQLLILGLLKYYTK